MNRGPDPKGLSSQHQIVALLPAHNEEEHILNAIAGLRAQTRRIDRIIVVADNCTDATESRARDAGAEVFVTSGNRHKKAGALNQALDALLLAGQYADDRQVLIQDADTVLNPEFADSAYKALLDPHVGGACARYNSPPGGGLIGLFQRNEYARSRRTISRRGRTHVLVGMAAQFRVGTLREVIRLRASGGVPGLAAAYNRDSITEDYDLSLALRTLGYVLVAPAGCDPLTDMMGTVPELWRQRVRWYRGALDDLRRFGWTRATRPYIMRQAAWVAASLSPLVFVAYLAAEFQATGRIRWALPYLAVNLIFVAERYVATRRQGFASIALAMILIPEMLYESFLTAVYLTSFAKHLRRTPAQW
jgi:cellulose synthase/poly-beta-1,6-N-acetylglucosamine synthase-like glycosyltransferase